MAKQQTFNIRLTKKEFTKLAELLYLGHEATIDREKDHNAYDAALDAFFDQAAEAGMGRLADMDMVAEEVDVVETLESYRALVTWQFLAVELSARDMINTFNIDIDSEALHINNLSTQALDYLKERSVYYVELLMDTGVDCIEIIGPTDESPVEIIDL